MGKLFLSQLTLSHFRSHRRAVVDLDERPVAIYGPNGAGKTNILEAVSLLSPGRGLRRSSAEDMTRKPEALGWKVTGLLHAPKGVNEIEVWSENSTARQLRIDGKAVPQTTLAQISRVLWLIPAMDRLWIEGAEGRRRFLDRMTLSFFPQHAAQSLTYEKAMRERNRLLKDMVREPSWYAALEHTMAQTGSAIHENRLRALDEIVAAQAKAQTSFPAADLTLICEMPPDASDLQNALAENRTRDLAAGRTLIGPHRADLQGVYAAKQVSAKECSTGEQKALLVSLILANARALADSFGAPPILLLDEVAAHLDAQRLEALYDEICTLGAQAWMTGTGPEMFAALGTRATQLHVSEDADQSQVTQVP